MKKTFFVFLMAVAIVLHLATAYNCTALHGENRNVCRYVESQSWSQSEKDAIIQESINTRGSLNGDFVSITTKPVKDEVQLNQVQEINELISDENKETLIEFSSLSVFGYVIYGFLKKYYLLLRLL